MISNLRGYSNTVLNFPKDGSVVRVVLCRLHITMLSEIRGIFNHSERLQEEREGGRGEENLANLADRCRALVKKLPNFQDIPFLLDILFFS
jgi:hypothetical protein